MADRPFRPLLAATLALLPAVACGVAPPPGPSGGTVSEPPPSEVAGRYRLNDDLVLVVSATEGRLELLPSFWRTAQILEATGEDAFQSLLHPQIKFQLLRNGEGRVIALRTEGHDELAGTATRLADGEILPVEHLLNGEARRAVASLVEAGLDSPDRAVELAFRHLGNFPSRSATSVAFAEELVARFPGDAAVQRLLGFALVQAGRRGEALQAFRRSWSLDPESDLTRMALRLLEPEGLPAEPGDDEGWESPFDLKALFRPPSEEEIRQVRERWSGRDLSPKAVRQEDATSLVKGSTTYDVRILSHEIGESRHYGAVLVPEGATPGCCPVIVDIRGVGWNYPPREISHGIRTMEILREDAGRVVYAVPGLRGEILEIHGESYRSEGDRRDGWDGAADDVIAFLGAALESTPEADGERVCLYGKSRGGSVALLAAARDPRVDCVVDWAGPADWFSLMGSMGWSLRELVEEGLRRRWKPGQGWGSAAQFIERYLEDPVETGRPGLEESRLRMLAASPLFFVESLPAADLHYGTEDRSVQVANGRALRRRLAGMEADGVERTVHLHEGSGHDMPWPRAYDISRAFLLRHLEGGRNRDAAPSP